MIESKNIGKNAVWGTFYTLIGDYFVYAVNFIRGIILARILMPEMYGVMTMAEFFRSLFAQPSQIGLDEAVIQLRPNIPQREEIEKAFNGHFVLRLMAFGVSLLVVLIATPILRRFYDPDVILVLYALTVILLVQSLNSTQITYFRKNLKFKVLSVTNVVASMVAFGVSLFLAGQGYGVWALVSVLMSVEVVFFISLWLNSPWRPSLNIDWKLNKNLASFGLMIWIGGFFGFVMLQFDDFLVGQFAGLATLGFYAKAYGLAQQPLGLFSQVMNKVAGPVIAELKDQPHKLEVGFNIVVSLIFKGTIFMGMVLFIWAPEIITLLIGEKWLPMVPMFRALIFYLVAQPVWDIIGSFFNYTGKPKLFAKGQGLQAGLLLSVGSVVVYFFGGLGAAVIVSAIVAMVTVVYLKTFVAREVRIDWRNVFIIPLLAVVASGLVSQMLINRWLASEWLASEWLFWGAVMIVPTVSYLGLIVLLQGRKVREEINFIIQTAKRKE